MKVRRCRQLFLETMSRTVLHNDNKQMYVFETSGTVGLVLYKLSFWGHGWWYGPRIMYETFTNTLPRHLLTHPSTYLFTFLPTFLLLHRLLTYPRSFLPTRQPVYPPTYLPTHPPTYYPTTYLTVLSRRTSYYERDCNLRKFVSNISLKSWIYTTICLIR